MCTSAVWPSMRIVSTMPSAVSGLTKADAPSAGVVPSGSTRQSAAFSVRYCEYIAPPSAATVLPIRCCAPAPAAITTPAPSLPTGIDLSSRAVIDFNAAAETVAVITGRSAVPLARAFVMSAPASSKPRSDGLMGAASIRSTTSSALGSAVATSASESSSSPVDFTSERS